jgi:uncharacterized protein (UPF0218 family)
MKPFTNGELVKECMVAVPEKRRQIEDINFSQFTVCCRIYDTAGSIEKSLINTICSFQLIH